MDIIFHFERAYQILDEFLLAGEVQESNSKAVLQSIHEQEATLVSDVLASDLGLLWGLRFISGNLFFFSDYTFC